MRERTTWNREDVQKRASAMSKRAEDPTAMNQDHIQRQPSADKYLTGDPSTFAEDVHPSAKNWKAEYSDGTTSRNEIGMPEMRDDTFNHPETDPGSSPARGGGGRQASLDEETLVKKADLCCKVARQILGPKAKEAAVEDQALALMNLSDSDLIATVNRMAQDQDQGQQDQGQKQAQDQGQQDQGQEQQKQAQDQQDQGQEKQAKDLPPEFLENIQKKKDEAKDKKDDKEASSKLATLEQMAQQLQQMAQQVQQMMSQGQMPQQQQAQDQVMQEQVQQAPAQQEQQALDQMLSPQGNDQMIDQMLQEQAPVVQAGDFGIQLDSPTMDIGEVGMGPEDDVLSTLFANNQEVQNAQTAHTLQHGAPAPMQVQATAQTRTASTRTIGTRPTAGVSSIGGLGSPAPAAGGGEVEKLANLWNSAPDVSDVFRS